jgi:hypothetical protein
MRTSWSTPGGSVERGDGEADEVVVELEDAAPVGLVAGSGSVPQPVMVSAVAARSRESPRFTCATLGAVLEAAFSP